LPCFAKWLSFPYGSGWHSCPFFRPVSVCLFEANMSEPSERTSRTRHQLIILYLILFLVLAPFLARLMVYLIKFGWPRIRDLFS
jgi:hypothetical protein